MEITIPYDQGKARIARRAAEGCLTCPTGSAITSDVALDILEVVENNIRMLGYKDLKTPRFPLQGMPIKAASSTQMTGNVRYRYSVHYDDVHRTPFYDPTPSPTQYDITRDLLQKCGNNPATAQLVANANSLGCAPPRGDRGLSGRRIYGQQAFTSVKELGPFCVTDFQDRQDFGAVMAAYKAAAIRASGMSLEYEKMRRFVDMSLNNGVAQSGTIAPTLQPSTFPGIPDSPGSFEWVVNAIEQGLGGELDWDTPVMVAISRRLFAYYWNKYVQDHDVRVEGNWQDIKMQAQGYESSLTEGTFTMTSLSTGRKIKFMVEGMPVFCEMYLTGDGVGEWDFQRLYVTELGDDNRTRQANGFWQKYNSAYGNPALYSCEGEQKTLTEMIFIYTENAFHYEGFPAVQGVQMQGVEASLNNLWGQTDINWFFGLEVDRYWLDIMNEQLAGTGAPCFNNRDKTWFAGVIKTGAQLIEDEPREMMALMVAVPLEDSPIVKSPTILPCTPPAAIEIGARPPKEGPELCVPLPDADVDAETAGCALIPRRVSYDLPCGSSNRTVQLTLTRINGANGTLAVPYSVTEGTALEGTAPTDHFRLAAGTATFADGEDTVNIAIVLHPITREDGDPAYVTATIVIDNSPEVVCEGGNEEIVLCLRLCQQGGTDEDSCPSGDCVAC